MLHALPNRRHTPKMLIVAAPLTMSIILRNMPMLLFLDPSQLQPIRHSACRLQALMRGFTQTQIAAKHACRSEALQTMYKSLS